MNVEQTYTGDPFLVTVADYDTDFISDTAYEDYGLVYNTGSQVALLRPLRETWYICHLNVELHANVCIVRVVGGYSMCACSLLHHNSHRRPR